MSNNDRPSCKSSWLLVAGMLIMSGCQHLQLPAIDPTGERIFSSTEPARMALPSDSPCTAGCCLFPKPAWQQAVTPPPCPEPPPPAPGTPYAAAPRTMVQPQRPQKGIPGKIMVNPTRMIAPVGSEVVLVGGLCGDDGYLITHQSIEWMLSQDSVGQIVEVSDKGSFWTSSKKLSADYAITKTSSRGEVITRGTPSVTDDIVQQKGQCWVSLTSASEGASYVTVVAPEGATWPQRRQSATIYWVDAQWALPNPVAVPAGQAFTLSTSVTRTATNAPVTGYIVRYEVVDGTPAVLGPGGATAVEVRTDDNGIGSAVLQPTSSLPGVTQIRIQIIRPPDPASDAPRTKLGEGYTSITWSAPGLALRATGPQTAAVDTTLVYRLEVQNPGDITTRDVVVRDVLPPKVKFVSSNPPAQIFGDRAEWRLGDLAAKSVQVIEVNLRPDAGGSIRYAFQATSADGLRADAFADTEITRPSLSLKVTGPSSATVGERVQFRIEVTNGGDQALENVTITDRFDAGLQQVEGLTSPIQKLIGSLAPGQTEQFAVGFIVQKTGQICHVLEVSAPGGQYAQQQACLTANEPAVTPQPQMQVTKSAPPESRVGQTIQFSTRVTNTGNVPLTDVRITDSYDGELEPKESTPGWDPAALAAGQLVWVIPELMPGETERRDVLCLCREPAEAASSRVTVTTDEDLSDVAQAVVRILPAVTLPPGTRPPAVQSPAAGSLTVDISEFGDPLRIGEQTAYVITIKNDRPVPDQNVVLTVQFPDGLRFEKLSGPVARRNVSADGRTVQVSPVLEMRANETLTAFRVEATGVKAGEHVLKVIVTSRLTPNGITAEETTTVTTQ